MSGRILGSSALAFNPPGSTVGADDEMTDSPISDSGNKRTTARWALSLPCRFSSEGALKRGTITDLSLGGAFIESDDCPLAGAKVLVRITLSSREFELPGVVRHAGWFLQEFRNGTGFGVEFGRLSPNGKALIEKIVERLDTPAPIKASLER